MFVTITTVCYFRLYFLSSTPSSLSSSMLPLDHSISAYRLPKQLSISILAHRKRKHKRFCSTELSNFHEIASSKERTYLTTTLPVRNLRRRFYQQWDHFFSVSFSAFLLSLSLLTQLSSNDQYRSLSRLQIDSFATSVIRPHRITRSQDQIQVTSETTYILDSSEPFTSTSAFRWTKTKQLARPEWRSNSMEANGALWQLSSSWP